MAPADRPGPAIAKGLGAGAAAAAVIVLLGGLLGVSAGLLVVALVTGWGVARVMAGGPVGGPPGESPDVAGEAADRTRPWLAVAIAVGAVALGQLGLWLFARLEGGVLSPIDYLAQTFGPLVPVQRIVTGVAAWWTAR
jgi:hypothetical protein